MKGSDEVEILELTDKVFEYYRKNTKGNENISRDQVARKLTRNVLLAKEVPPRNAIDRLLGNCMYHYGNLHIVVRRNKIVHIRNYKNQNNYKNWELDRFKYVDLSRELGIEG
jgi:hypothetical protein